MQTIRDAIGAELIAVLDTYISPDSDLDACAAAEVAMEWVVAYLLTMTRKPCSQREAFAASDEFFCGVDNKMAQFRVAPALTAERRAKP
jgi:hypothetical protein